MFCFSYGFQLCHGCGWYLVLKSRVGISKICAERTKLENLCQILQENPDFITKKVIKYIFFLVFCSPHATIEGVVM